MILSPYALLGLAYMAGATPTSFGVAKGVYGVDLRTEGSGNLGATNTFRVLGWKAALPVIVADVFKGWFPTWYFPQIDGDAAWGWTLAYGGAAILGHVFSVWVGFKGGKGIATSGGVYAAIAPTALLIGVAAWITILALTRFVSVGSMGAALVLPLAVYLTPHEGGDSVFWFTVVLAAFVIWAHRSNVGRLLRREELAFGRGAFGSAGTGHADESAPGGSA